MVEIRREIAEMLRLASQKTPHMEALVMVAIVDGKLVMAHSRLEDEAKVAMLDRARASLVA